MEYWQLVPNAAIRKLQTRAAAHGLPFHFSRVTGCATIETPLITIDIQQRPPYCDRGRWIVFAESKDDSKLVIDHADLFPRYYFGDVALCSEMAAWLKAREQYAVVAFDG